MGPWILRHPPEFAIREVYIFSFPCLPSHNLHANFNRFYTRKIELPNQGDSADSIDRAGSEARKNNKPVLRLHANSKRHPFLPPARDNTDFNRPLLPAIDQVIAIVNWRKPRQFGPSHRSSQHRSALRRQEGNRAKVRRGSWAGPIPTQEGNLKYRKKPVRTFVYQGNNDGMAGSTEPRAGNIAPAVDSFATTVKRVVDMLIRREGEEKDCHPQPDIDLCKKPWVSSNKVTWIIVGVVV